MDSRLHRPCNADGSPLALGEAGKQKLIQENAAELKSSREMRKAHLAGTKHRTQIKIAGPPTTDERTLCLEKEKCAERC